MRTQMSTIESVAASPARRKSIDRLRHDAEAYGLKRVLGRANLVLLGIGCIIGAGIYVLTGLELGIAVALVAVGFSGYMVSFLRDFGIVVPTQWVTPFVAMTTTPDGH